MRVAAVLLIALAVASCQPGRQATEPPVRYEGDATAAVRFVGDSVAACAGATVEPGHGPAEGCFKDARVVLPNPCSWPGSDTYAELACHELGHWNGWPASHPR